MSINEEISLINEKIAKFYDIPNNVTGQAVEKYFGPNKTLNFEEISRLCYPDIKEVADLKNYKYEDYLHCYQKLQPHFADCLNLLKELPAAHLELEWLGGNFKYIDIQLRQLHEENTLAVEHILLLTAMLEYALGNVYFTLTAGGTPPHLLRDLLSTDALLEMFGLDAIVYLKILLGTPNSINLRNIVWHGFPAHNDIPTFYVAVLLLVIHTLGAKLQQMDLKLDQRPQVENFDRLTSKLETYFPNTTFSNDVLEQHLETRHLRLRYAYQLYWQQLLYYYKTQQFWKFVVLILPQIELLLRLKYAQANDCDVSAKLDEYYITIDTLLENDVHIADKNKLYKNNILLFKTNSINEGALKCVYDLFVATNGPRLRDKVSHGEVTITAINSAMLCRMLMHLSFNLLNAKEEQFSLQNYESKFHLNCIAKEALAAAHMQLQEFINTHLAVKLSNQLNEIKGSNMCIFGRPKKETEYMHLVLRIAELISKICANYTTALNTRLTLLAQHELHSKRRRTLERLLKALPIIFKTLQKLYNCLHEIFMRLQNDNAEVLLDSVVIIKTLRFLKHTLKICENLVKYSDQENNEWLKALELCCRFDTLRSELFIWHCSCAELQQQ